MRPAERPPRIDRVRVAATARSVLSNLDVLNREGLLDARRPSMQAAAEFLSLADEPGDQPPSDEIAMTGAELRGALARLSGPAADALTTWLDDALGRAE